MMKREEGLSWVDILSNSVGLLKKLLKLKFRKMSISVGEKDQLNFFLRFCSDRSSRNSNLCLFVPPFVRSSVRA